MPIYDYDCAACGRRFEDVHGVHSDGPTTCPLCGKGPVRKAITAATVHYKGSGWAKKERRTTAGSGASKSAEGATSGTSGSEDGSKSDAAASSDAEPSGSSPKKSESGSPGSSGSDASKTTEKPSKTGASPTSD